MTRDRLLATIKALHAAAMHDESSWEDDEDVKDAIDWLEKMPDGVSLHCSDWWKSGHAGPPREPVR